MRVLSFDELKPERGIGFCREQIRRLVKAGKFPRPIELGENRVAWRVDEVDAWLEARPRRKLAGEDVQAAA